MRSAPPLRTIAARLARPLAAVVCLLLAALALAGDEPSRDRWMPSLAEAQRVAREEQKPVIAVFLDAGAPSASLERQLDRDRALGAVLDGFVAVKLDAGTQRDLVARYHMASFPAVLFLTPGGRAIKLMVGIASAPRVKAEAEAAAAKWEQIRDPASWQPTRKRSPPPRPAGPVRLHVSSCPVDCEFCAPAIERGLAWLVKHQSPGGNWAKPVEETQTRTDDGRVLTRSIDHIDTALTAVAGLALLTTGSTPGKGRYGGELTRAKAYLARAVRDDGVISTKGAEFVYYAHAIFETSLAATFLAECQKTESDVALAGRLACVSRGLAAAQDETCGAWGYSFDAKRNPRSDKTGWRLLATTHCALSALNALHDAGVPVDDAARARAVRYLTSCVGPDGAFTYRSELRGMDGYPGATAGALFAIARSGASPQPDVEVAKRRLRDDLARLDGYGEYWWFMVLYTALAANDQGEGAWRAFRDEYRDLVLANQDEDGSFHDPDDQGGAVFATSVALIVLQMDAHPLPVSGRRTGERPIDVVASPAYLKVPDPLSRVKVFEKDGRYLADLVVSVDGPADDAYLAHLADGLRGASRILFDVTDGQMCLHRVTIHACGAKADTADVLVTKRFYEDPDVPRGAPHGVTMVTRRTEVRSGGDVELPRIGEWVKLPWALTDGTPVPWHHWGLTRVIAHELCHYVLGVQDEYGMGGSYCACLMGDLLTSELCLGDDHTDDRRERSCWAQAKLLYPHLAIPTSRDAGPWDPPLPRIDVVK